MTGRGLKGAPAMATEGSRAERREPCNPAPGATLLARGVYRYPCLSRRGHAIWIAIDSRHRCVKSLTVHGERTEAAVRHVLRGLLDLLDAPAREIRPVLRLIHSEPSTDLKAAASTRRRDWRTRTKTGETR